MNVISANHIPDPTLKFKQIAKVKDGWEVIKNLFSKIIDPLYKTEGDTLDKIRQNKDRKTRILCSNKKPVGLVVYKSLTSNDYGLTNSLEIVTLCLINPTTMSNKGYGQTLLNKVINFATDTLRANSIHVRVPSSAQSALAFFTKKGFKVKQVFKTNVPIEENLLVLKIKELNGAFSIPNGQLRIAGAGSNESSSQNASSTSEPMPLPPLHFPPISAYSHSSNHSNSSSGENSSVTKMKVDTLTESSKKRKRDDMDEKEFVDPRTQETNPNKRSRSDSSSSKMPDHYSNNSNGNSSAKVEKIPLRQPYLGQIISGKKTIEGRINSYPFNKLREGMKIQFFNGNEFVYCTITTIKIYGSFRKMLESEGVERCLPGVQSVDKGEAIYNGIPNYKEKAGKFGVMAIHIKKDK